MSVTVDLWSWPGFSASFISVTCHFIDPDQYLLQSCLLACKKIDQPHTAENIFLVYNNIISTWKINESKIFRIVTDNGSNITKAFRLVYFFSFFSLFSYINN